jgi:hypothetical protein
MLIELERKAAKGMVSRMELFEQIRRDPRVTRSHTDSIRSMPKSGERAYAFLADAVKVLRQRGYIGVQRGYIGVFRSGGTR